MLYYDRLDLRDGIFVNSISDSHKSKISCHNYFIKTNFSFRKCVCNDCHDLL